MRKMPQINSVSVLVRSIYLACPRGSNNLEKCQLSYQHRFVFWRRQWHPTPELLPGKSHGQRSLVGCSPWGREESNMTERLPFHFSLSCIGEGNGTPLQCSWLENPRDGGAWWAAVQGNQTRMKRLSSSILLFGLLWYSQRIFILNNFYPKINRSYFRNQC